VFAYATTCVSTDPPYQLWWLAAVDAERSALLLLATPMNEGPALRAAGDRLLAALGMVGAAATAPAPGAAAAAPSPPASATVEMRVVRGLMRDKPFSLAYPSALEERQEANYDLFLRDSDGRFEVSLTIAPDADGSQIAEIRGRSNAELAQSMAAYPHWRLVGQGPVQLPGGSAFAEVWSVTWTGTPPLVTRYMFIHLSDGGRIYTLSVGLPEADLARWRGAVGLILANFGTTSASRPLVAEPVALPW
jgi:hypothetical protein